MERPAVAILDVPSCWLRSQAEAWLPRAPSSARGAVSPTSRLARGPGLGSCRPGGGGQDVTGHTDDSAFAQRME